MLYPQTAQALATYAAFCAENKPDPAAPWIFRLQKDNLRRQIGYTWWLEYARQRGYDSESYIHIRSSDVDRIRSLVA